MKLEFLARSSRKTEKLSFIKIRQVGADLFHVDRQTQTEERTDMKLTVAFRNSANAPRNNHSISKTISLQP